jgi:hypothetical protein
VACREILNLINRSCLEKKLISAPTDLICFTCAFINYWAGLHPNNEQDLLRAGAGALQENALAGTMRTRRRIALTRVPGANFVRDTKWEDDDIDNKH